MITYDDGEVRQQFSICFRARPVGGTLRPGDESTDVCWVAHAELDELPIHPEMRLRIDHGFAHNPEPHLG